MSFHKINEGLSMIHLNYLSATRISGPDAGSFLQSQLSADIGSLGAGQATFAAYCTPKGQVLGLMLVCNAGDEFFLAASSGLLASMIQRLKIFVMRSRVEWDDSRELKVLGIPTHAEAPSGSCAFSPADLQLTYAIGAQAPCSFIDAENWKSQELRLGIAWLDSSTTEKFIPQMLGEDLIGALSFSKGCYPGQEIVARARYLGKVKRKPLIVTAQGQVQLENASKLEIHYPNESVSGTLIDSAKNEAGDTVLFIVTNLLEGQQPVSINCDGKIFEL
jgi:folate-binding protein YgfZ